MQFSAYRLQCSACSASLGVGPHQPEVFQPCDPSRQPGRERLQPRPQGQDGDGEGGQRQEGGWQEVARTLQEHGNLKLNQICGFLDTLFFLSLETRSSSRKVTENIPTGHIIPNWGS